MCEVCTRFMKHGEKPIKDECHPEIEIRLDADALRRAY